MRRIALGLIISLVAASSVAAEQQQGETTCYVNRFTQSRFCDTYSKGAIVGRTICHTTGKCEAHFYGRWGDPLPMRQTDDGEVWQLEVCQHRDGGTYSGCFVYGANDVDSTVCARSLAQAKIDFPGENYPCAWVKRSDIERVYEMK